MKNLSHYILLLMVVTALQACKKDNHTDPVVNTPDKLYPITFNVTNTVQQTKLASKMGTTASFPISEPYINPLKGGINTIDYMLYDVNGILKKHSTFHSPEANFGSISDNVSAGNYTVAIVGSIDSSGYSNRNIGEDGYYRFVSVQDSLFGYAYSSSIYSTSGGEEQWYDAFFKKFSLTVPGSGINQNITLTRIVAQVELYILDALPDNATSLSFEIKDDRSYYSALKDMPAAQITTHSNIHSTNITNTNRKNFKISAIVVDTASPFSAIVSVYGTNGLITKKTINDIRCQKNTKTILSGKLFSCGATNGSGFQISVKTGFDGDINSSF